MTITQELRDAYRHAYKQLIDANAEYHSMVEHAMLGNGITNQASAMAALRRVHKAHLEWLVASEPFLDLD